MPSCASATRVSSRIRSRSSMPSRPAMPGRAGSRPRNRFSATDRSGASARSWYTVCTPSSSAWPIDWTETGSPQYASVPESACDRAAQDLGQGGLAGAVVAHQREHLARPQVEVRTPQRLEVPEGLGDAPRADGGRVRGRRGRDPGRIQRAGRRRLDGTRHQSPARLGLGRYRSRRIEVVRPQLYDLSGMRPILPSGCQGRWGGPPARPGRVRQRLAVDGQLATVDDERGAGDIGRFGAGQERDRPRDLARRRRCGPAGCPRTGGRRRSWVGSISVSMVPGATALTRMS